MRRTEAQATLGELAADQFGLVTSAQAADRGIDGKTLQRLRDANLVEQVGRGVYRIAGAATPSHLETRIAWLRLDPERPAWERDGRGMRDGVVSHRSACLLHQLGDIPAPNVEMTVPKRLTTRDPWVVLHRHDGPLPADDITVVEGLPVTTAARTVVDLIRDGADAGHVGGVIADAERRGLLDLRDLADRVEPFAARYALPGGSGEELISTLVAGAGQRLGREKALETLDQAASAGYLTALRNVLVHRALPQDLSEEVARQLLTAVWRHEDGESSPWRQALTALLESGHVRQGALEVLARLESPAADELRNQLTAHLLAAAPSDAPSALHALLAHEQALEAADPDTRAARDAIHLSPAAATALALAGVPTDGNEAADAAARDTVER